MSTTSIGADRLFHPPQSFDDRARFGVANSKLRHHRLRVMCPRALDLISYPVLVSPLEQFLERGPDRASIAADPVTAPAAVALDELNSRLRRRNARRHRPGRGVVAREQESFDCASLVARKTTDYSHMGHDQRPMTVREFSRPPGIVTAPAVRGVKARASGKALDRLFRRGGARSKDSSLH